MSRAYSGIIFSLKEGGNCDRLYDTGEARGCHAPRRQPVTKRQAPRDSTDVMQSLERLDSERQKIEWRREGDGGGGWVSWVQSFGFAR